MKLWDSQFSYHREHPQILKLIFHLVTRFLRKEPPDRHATGACGLPLYFFYIDESGTRDPEVVKTKADGTTAPKEHLYVLTAVSLFEGRWRAFDREIGNLKLELALPRFGGQGMCKCVSWGQHT